MAKRRQKKRTHAVANEDEVAKVPRSMVLRIGSNMKNRSLTQLVRDMRNVMQPHTAIRLRERKSNKLRDFVVMAGPLNVSHLMVFSQSEAGTTQLRLARMSRGPTITFKVENYSLAKDVKRIQKHPKSITKESKEFLNPPLLVLNGFTNPANAEPHEKLLITTFQNMFPPIQPQSTKVSSVRRVLMINKDPETGVIDIRHYAIDTKPVEGSKTVKKLINTKSHLNKRLPNLHNATDAADLLLDPYANAFTSDSEVEEDSIVDVKEDNVASISRKKEEASTEDSIPATRKKAIKLTEIGPRLRLHLTKIEEGISSGKVLYHSNVKKSKKEIASLEIKHKERQKVKEQRKQVQSENIAQKKAKKDAKKERRKQREQERSGKDGEASGSEDESGDDNEDEDEDDKIPEDLDSDLYSDVDEIAADSD